MDWLAWLPSDWLTRMFLALIPAIAIAILRWIFRSRRKEIALRSKIETTTAIDDLRSNPRLSIRHGDIPIQNLQVTTALLWNDGRNPIKRDNIAPADQLRITFPEGTRLLETSLLYQTREGSATQIESESEAVRVEFDFLNPYDAVLIHCLHTGSPDEVLLEGELIGSTVSLDSDWDARMGVHGAEVDGKTHLVDLRRLRNYGSGVYLIMVCVLVAAFLFGSWPTVMSLAAALFVFAVYTLWPSNAIPRKVRKDLQAFVMEQQQKPNGAGGVALD